MRNGSLLLGVAVWFLFASAVGAQEPEGTLHDPGPDEHLLYGVADVAWQDGPGSFEAGSQVAILEGDPGAPGVFTMRIRMPDGFRIAPHFHPNVERVTVLSGTFHLGSGEVLDPDATTALGPGSYTSMPPGMRHFAIAEGETVIQLTSVGPWIINYVNPEDDPRRRD
jgi:quercetin dioxygenase-like cupin family protein